MAVIIHPNSADPFGDGSLLAKYRLDGDINDTTGNFNGTASNITYDTGKFGQAGVFNGLDSYVDHVGGDLGVGAKSISAWVKIDEVGLYGFIACDCDGSLTGSEGVTGTSLLVHPTLNKILWSFKTQNRNRWSFNLLSTTALTVGVWYHVVATWDGTTDVNGVSLSVNGEIDYGTAQTSQTVSPSGGKISIGKNAQVATSTAYRFKGSIDQVEIYNRALTVGEMILLRTQDDTVVTDPAVNLLLSLSTIVWSNKETKEQANPQPIYLANYGIEPINSKYVVKNNPFYNDVVLDQQGNQRKLGYIASKTELSGVPVPHKRVMIFANDNGLLLDETISDGQGNYRFDSLLMSKKYMITAQYGNFDEHTPPDYNATSTDWQTPTSYEV